MSEESRQPKTEEELEELRKEFETLNEKLNELSEEELAQVTGGVFPGLSGFP